MKSVLPLEPSVVPSKVSQYSWNGLLCAPEKTSIINLIANNARWHYKGMQNVCNIVKKNKHLKCKEKDLGLLDKVRKCFRLWV